MYVIARTLMLQQQIQDITRAGPELCREQQVVVPVSQHSIDK
jgi:hypothetical protein